MQGHPGGGRGPRAVSGGGARRHGGRAGREAAARQGARRALQHGVQGSRARRCHRPRGGSARSLADPVWACRTPNCCARVRPRACRWPPKCSPIAPTSRMARSPPAASPAASSTTRERSSSARCGWSSDQTVIAVDGSTIALQADTICLHGDTPGAADHARAVRAGLEAAGITSHEPSDVTERRRTASSPEMTKGGAPDTERRPKVAANLAPPSYCSTNATVNRLATRTNNPKSVPRGFRPNFRRFLRPAPCTTPTNLIAAITESCASRPRLPDTAARAAAPWSGCRPWCPAASRRRRSRSAARRCGGPTAR